MVWTGVLTTSAKAIKNAGVGASAVAAVEAFIQTWSDDAEGAICAYCHTDFVTNYSSLQTEIKSALSDVCSSMIAMNIVSYDMSGYTDRREAETILDILDNQVNRGLQVLKDKVMQKLS